MKHDRMVRVNRLLQTTLADMVPGIVKDPRIAESVIVSVIDVRATPDLRQAKVHVSIMGDEAKQKLGLRGLQHAAGFLQSKLSSRIDTRYTPRIEFVLDQGVKQSIEIARILKEVLPRESEEEPEETESPGTEPD